MKFLTALIAGLLFGYGLLVSGMTNPANVLGFLDVFGEWRPQLAFVMGAAVLTAAPSFWFVRRSRHNLLGASVDMPDRRRIDKPLLIGARCSAWAGDSAAYAQDPASCCSPAEMEWPFCSWRP